MGKSAKPRHAYNTDKRRVHVPMMKNSRDNLALQLHAAVETLIGAPGIDAFNRVSKMVARTESALGRPDACLNAAKEALYAISERFARVGKVGVSDEEAKRLKTASGDIDKLLPKIPANVMRQAGIQTALHCEALEAA